MTQPEALRHADKLDAHEFDEPHGAAAELRRLSEIETLYLAAMRGRHAMSEELLALTAQRDALLEALKLSRAQWIHSVNSDHCLAAIKAAEENT